MKIISNVIKATAFLAYFNLGFAFSIFANDITVNVTNSTAPYPIGNDGAINLQVEGGFAPYSYVWTGPYGFTSYDEDLNGIYPGIYHVIVTDGLCGIAELNVEVGYECELVINSITPICICPGQYGSAHATVTGGSGNYSYLWTNISSDETTTGANPELTEVGDYSLVVIDNISGCSATAANTIHVANCNLATSNFDIDITQACDGPNTGSIMVDLLGKIGVGPYLFKWYRMNGTQQVLLTEQTSANGQTTLPNLGAGFYCFNVVSMNGCEVTKCSLQIREYQPPIIDAVLTPVTTIGATDGMIALTATGGTGPITYKWSTTPVQTASTLSNVPAGTYSVTVTYGWQNGLGVCYDVYTYTLHDCEQLTNSINPQTVVYGTEPAIIDLTVTNLSGYGFTYAWSSSTNLGFSATTEDIKPGMAGNYCVSITYPVCNYSLYPHCDEICGFDMFFTSVPSFPPDQCNTTSLTINTSQTVEYLWSNGETGKTIVADFGQDYCVTVTGNAGCDEVACITTTLPDISLYLTSTNATFGSNNGTATAFVNGGIAPYDYVWNNPSASTTASINNLSTGDYCVTVTDDCGTTATGCVNIQCQFNNSILSAYVRAPNCSAGTKGSIDLSVNPPSGMQVSQFSYLWSNGFQGQDLSQLLPGQYCVTVTHTSGCKASKCFSILNGVGTFAIDFELDGGCLGGNNGSITAIPSGTGTFSYSWSAFTSGTFNGIPFSGNTQTINNLEVGWYYVTITNDIGCTATDWTFLYDNQPPFKMEVDISPNPICADGETAEGDIVYTSGQPTPPVAYTWRNFTTLETINTTATHLEGLEPGYWGVSVTDGTGCVWQQAIELFQNDEIEAIIVACDAVSPNQNGPSYPPTSIIKVLSVTGGTPPYDFQWSNGVEPILNISVVPIGNYFVTITDAVGCTFSDNFQIDYIEDWRDLSVVTTATGADCTCCEFGGAIHVSIQDFTSFPFYLWHYEETNVGVVPVEFLGPFYTTEFDFYDLRVGVEHYFKVALGGDSNGDGNNDCNSSIFFEPATIEPANPVEIVLSGISSVPSYIDISVTGGQSPYTYLWSNGATTQDISNIPGGSYTVTVTDNTGCEEVGVFEICINPPQYLSYYFPIGTPPGGLSPCKDGVSKGRIYGPTMVGGTPPYSYSWSGPNGFVAFTQDILMLDVEGEYCLTITDACYVEFEYCRDLVCDCTVNVSVSGDVCAQDDSGWFTIKSISPWENEYEIHWFNGDVDNVWVEENGELVLISGGTLNAEVDEPFEGVLCVTIVSVSQPSCQTKICREYYGDDQCLYRFVTFTNNNDDDLEDYLINEYGGYYSDYITNCYSDNPCGDSGGGGAEQMTFTPYSNINPCLAGGLLECDECNYSELWMNVPPNSEGISIEMNNNCYCLWPAALLSTDPDFIDALYNSNSSTIGNNEVLEQLWSLGVVAEYDCNGPTITPPTGGGGNNPLDDECIDLACDVCPDGCIIVPDEQEETCQFLVWCENDINPANTVQCPSFGTTRMICKENKIRDAVYSTSDCLYEIYEQCTINPCQKNLLFECGENSCQLDLETYGLYEMVDCAYESHPLSICNCHDLYNSEIPDCISCEQSGGLFQSDNESSKLKQIEKQNSYGSGKLKTNHFKVDISPNPFHDEITISITSSFEDVVELKVVDAFGKQIWLKKSKIFVGSTPFVWRPSQYLPFGVYSFIFTTSDGSINASKIIHAE